MHRDLQLLMILISVNMRSTSTEQSLNYYAVEKIIPNARSVVPLRSLSVLPPKLRWV
jgi:hypothetical protein